MFIFFFYFFNKLAICIVLCTFLTEHLNSTKCFFKKIRTFPTPRSRQNMGDKSKLAVSACKIYGNLFVSTRGGTTLYHR